MIRFLLTSLLPEIRYQIRRFLRRHKEMMIIFLVLLFYWILWMLYLNNNLLRLF